MKRIPGMKRIFDALAHPQASALISLAVGVVGLAIQIATKHAA